jgi:hypothetical protein
MPAFQAGDESSILSTRTITLRVTLYCHIDIIVTVFLAGAGVDAIIISVTILLSIAPVAQLDRARDF